MNPLPLQHLNPVSYTHLDVYKRQYGDSEDLCYLGNTLGKYYFYDMADAVSDVYGFEQHREARKNSRAETVNMDEAPDAKKAPDVIPVSYTHLDVYKRQDISFTFIFPITVPICR